MEQNEIRDTDVAAGISALEDVADEMDVEDGVVPAAQDVEPDGDQDSEIDDDVEEDEASEAGGDDDDDDEEPDEPREEGQPKQAAPTTEDPEAARPVMRDDGAQWNDAAKRWVKDGKFVDGTPPTPEQLAAAKPVAAASSPEPEAAQWQPFGVTVDRKPFDVPEAAVQFRKGGDGKEYAFIAVPKDDFGRFQARIGRGVLAERISRDIESQLREVEQLKAELEEERQHRPPAPEEIHAKEFLDALQGTGRYEGKAGFDQNLLGQLLEPWQLDLIEANAKLAIVEATKKYETEAVERRSAREEAATADDVQEQGLAETILDLASEHPELKDLTEAQLREVFEELKPYKRALFWREPEGWFKNTEQVFSALKRKATSITAAPSPAPAQGGQPGGATAVGARDDRFNAGQRTAVQPNAVKPPTTSVKARRDADQRPGTRPPTRSERRKAKRSNLSRDAREEVQHRSKVRNWMSSPDLDFPE